MRSREIIASWLVTTGILFVLFSLLAAGERVIVDGVVSAQKNETGKIVGVVLNLKVEGEDVFNIVLDENAERLAAEMDGKWVEVIGEVSSRGTERWLEINSYRRVEEKVLQ